MIHEYSWLLVVVILIVIVVVVKLPKLKKSQHVAGLGRAWPLAAHLTLPDKKWTNNAVQKVFSSLEYVGIIVTLIIL